MDDTEARERVGRIEALLEKVETLPDPAARETALEVAQALLDLYGEGLARVVAHVAERDEGELAAVFASDELISHLLLLHGLHPVPLEDRVHGALEEVRPYLESHGGNVELVAIEGGVVTLRMEGSCDGCPSSAVTLKLAIEDAIHKAAPDVEEIVAEPPSQPPASNGLIQLDIFPAAAAPPVPAATGLIQLEISHSARGPSEPAAGSWAMAGGMRDLMPDEPLLKRIAGEDVLFVRLSRATYAYRPACPGCGQSLADATLDDAHLICAGCASAYDVRRAGRCRETPESHLEPVPLLVDGDGLVKVALRAAA